MIDPPTISVPSSPTLHNLMNAPPTMTIPPASLARRNRKIHYREKSPAKKPSPEAPSVHATAPGEKKECPICRETVARLVVNQPCKHKFCLDCIKQWVLSSEESSDSCPMCRAVIDKITSEDTEGSADIHQRDRMEHEIQDEVENFIRDHSSQEDFEEEFAKCPRVDVEDDPNIWMEGNYRAVFYF
jgi:hypothetical protein